MLLSIVNPTIKILSPLCFSSRVSVVSKCYFSEGLYSKYNDVEREKILQVMNAPDVNTLSSYDVSKTNLKKFSQWKSSNGQIKTLSDIEYVEGFSERSAKKLFNSILNGPQEKKVTGKIKGQILHPHLSDKVIKDCKSVLAVYVTVNSVSWTLIDRSNYEVQEWKYYGINYPEGKRFQITDILDICGVGKSGIILAFTTGDYNPSFLATIGVDYKCKVIDVNGVKVKLGIWDTAGQERYRTLTSSFYREANGATIYDVSEPKSLAKLNEWVKELQVYSTQKNIVCLVVGNNIDMHIILGHIGSTARRRNEYSQGGLMSGMRLVIKQ